MKLASAQLTASSDKMANLKKACDYVEMAKDAGAEIILFPEMYMSYIPNDSEIRPAEIAETINGPFVSALAVAAKKNHIYIICGIYESFTNEFERAYNTVVIISNTGEIIGSYRKTHLCDAWNVKESDTFVPGNKPFEVVKTPFGKIGLIICYELRFPEISRQLALKILIFCLFLPPGTKVF
ncbi:hypothetical protein GCM10011409_21660 [Lentibacillus populi]|uniref:CN hydrolase domain-containing protein n=1 Tax=Lentibacillus populi TaxID=1827502 RepID=A0A9W5TXN9_9BACI|nr:hypothetical protein GCM10011409_21660 [Lentibacillus populi]